MRSFRHCLIALLPVFSLWSSDAPKDEDSKLTAIQQVEKLVVFLYALNNKGEDVPIGTGFLTAVEGANNLSHGYVVTARHVLKGLTTTKLRVNRTDGGADMLPIELTPERVFFHPDASVDLALIAFYPTEKRHD